MEKILINKFFYKTIEPSTKKNYFIKKRKYLFNIIVIMIFLSILLFSDDKLNYNLTFPKRTIEKNPTEEMINMQNYINLVLNGTLIDKDKLYYPSKNPLISIIISVYNGEAYLKTALLSIQNQELKDLEIIMVDDLSKDNSINLIKELMKNEPRIILLENKENRGPLYTKSTGVLHAKGKYVMTLDEDDMYCQREAFSSLI